ncbi:MAG: orotidine-5'-phosphate decarboxylase [Thermomicrobiales bacterium]
MIATPEPHTDPPTAATSPFVSALRARWTAGRHLCVGLDPLPERIPTAFTAGVSFADAVFAFNRTIVDATKGHVCAYKPNAAYYEALGKDGHRALVATVAYIHEMAPGIPVLLDAKRADIGETNERYAVAAFEIVGADAITVHPWFGRDALAPFLDRADKGIIVMAANSNPGAGEVQDLPVGPHAEPLAVHLARQVAERWNTHGNCGVTVGATNSARMAAVRAAVGDMPMLVLGIGAQGGDIDAAMQAGRDSTGAGMIVSTSRAVIYAAAPDAPPETVAEAIALAASSLNTRLANALAKPTLS